MPLLVRLLDIKNPLLGLGSVLLILAFVDTTGTAFSPTADPSYPLGVVGAALVAIGVALHLSEPKIREKQRFKDPALYEGPFWHEVFDAMPPAFIKAVKDGQINAVKDGQPIENLEHIAENTALEGFQQRGRPGTEIDKERDLIRADHHAGDKAALAGGSSLYLESSDTYGTNAARQIFTLKTLIEYGGREFVVGWFVPVELPTTLGRREVYRAKETGQQVTFGLIDAPDDEGKKIRIGGAARRAARNRSRRSAQQVASTPRTTQDG